MTPTAQIAAIRQRAEQATPGPWSYERCEDERGGIDYDIESWSKPARRRDTKIACGADSRFDAEFIAHAREDIPFLLKQWDTHQSALRALVAELRARQAEHAANGETPREGEVERCADELERLLESEQ